MTESRPLRAVPDPAQDDDATLDDLLTEVAAGNLRAFELLYPEVAGAVFGLALRVLGDRHLAEDVSQEVLVDVWRLAPRFDPARGRARSWVLTMAHRRAVDRVRREHSQTTRRHRAAGLATGDEPDVVIGELERQWDAALVRRALTQLSDLQREAIELAYYGGRTQVEVSVMLDIPLGTAKTRIRDGLIRLRGTLEVDG